MKVKFIKILFIENAITFLFKDCYPTKRQSFIPRLKEFMIFREVKFETVFSTTLLLNFLTLMKFADKLKTIDFRFDDYEACKRISHPNDLIFPLSFLHTHCHAGE